MMLDRWKSIIAIACGVCSLGGIVLGVWAGSHGKADASEVRSVDKRLTAVEPVLPVVLDLLKEQRRATEDIREQLNRWAITGRLTFQPATPPPMGPEPKVAP